VKINYDESNIEKMMFLGLWPEIRQGRWLPARVWWCNLDPLRLIESWPKVPVEMDATGVYKDIIKLAE